MLYHPWSKRSWIACSESSCKTHLWGCAKSWPGSRWGSPRSMGGKTGSWSVRRTVWAQAFRLAGDQKMLGGSVVVRKSQGKVMKCLTGVRGEASGRNLNPPCVHEKLHLAAKPWPHRTANLKRKRCCMRRPWMKGALHVWCSLFMVKIRLSQEKYQRLT